MLDPEVLLPFIEQLKSYFRIPKVVSKVDVELEYKDKNALKDFACKYYDYAVIELAKDKASLLVLKKLQNQI